MTDEILALNSSNELIAKDPNTGNVRPIEVSDLSASSRLNLDDGALLTLGSNDDFGLRYDATADSFVVADNTNGTDTVTVDRTTGNIDTVGDVSATNVSATNVSADTQMNSSSTRPDIFADTVDANQFVGIGELKLTNTDSPTTHTTTFRADGSFTDLYNSTTVNILTGAVYGSNAPKYRITFSDGSTTTVAPDGAKGGTVNTSNTYQVTPIPSTTDVDRVQIGGENFEGGVGAFILTV